MSVTTAFLPRLEAVFRTAISVNRLARLGFGRRQAGVLHQRTQVLEGDATVELHQGALDQLLDLSRTHGTGT